MTHSAADFQNNRTQWLIEALSLSSLEEALAHLGRGWLQFAPVAGVLIINQTFARASGSFLSVGEVPRFFPKIAAEKADFANPETRLLELLPRLPVADLSLQPILPLEWNRQALGWLAVWTKGETPTANVAWLEEATARVLANWRRIEEELQADKLNALGEFAAGAGHEINNPVATISGRVQGLLQSETDPERRRQLLTIGGQALRIRDMIGDTMLFARPPHPEPAHWDLKQALPEIVKPLADELAAANFACEIPEPVPIFADRSQLAVVITELLRNSLDWLSGGGNIRLAASAIETPTGPMAEIVLEDDGESFPAEHLPHLFDPFFCGRQAGRGLGFGLPKCWRIVSNHRGRIGIASLPDAGTRTTVIWPAYDFLSIPP